MLETIINFVDWTGVVEYLLIVAITFICIGICAAVYYGLGYVIHKIVSRGNEVLENHIMYKR